MNVNLLALLSICAYLGGSACLIKGFCQQPKRFIAIYSAWLAVIVHFIYLGVVFLQMNYFNFSLFNTASLISALVVLLLLLASLTKPVEKLGLVIFPFTALLLALDVIFPDKYSSFQSYSWQMNAHIFSSIIAFSLLSIAALQALFLAIQEKQLRCHPPRKFILNLPALQTMESLLFQMITIGLIFLSTSLLTGVLFIEDLFAQHLVHKTVLSIVAWLIFSALLTGRLNYGWRGQTAVRFTLVGFLLLLLAYFGSKLVLEVILNK
ncbi:MAG: cytochrome c biogenesis protein CcsA [Methylococcales bacterium]|nr:cytochrome c biogenesis protein CcsA [Methylococcales bacterium]